MSFSLCLIKAANTLFMTVSNLLHYRLPKIHDQQSLMLRRHSVSIWGREQLAFSVSYNGSQYFVYDRLQHVALEITQDTRPSIFDTPLTLIFNMRQGGYRRLCSYAGGQQFVYDCLQPISGVITQGARPEIVDTLLTLIWRHCIVDICCHR